MPNDQSNRDRIRALVRDVLDKALPADDQSGPAPGVSNSTTARPLLEPLPRTSSGPAAANVTRDESSQLIITEGDVRG
ncbi:MAG: hypothetical protein ACR2G5_04735, partial [Pyrinomonadaceae bacterium]